jgi:hypothetical protein
MTVASVTVTGVPSSQIDVAPAPVSNPPDPQVLSADTSNLQAQINNIAIATGATPVAGLSTDTSNLQAQINNIAIATGATPDSNPPDPQVSSGTVVAVPAADVATSAGSVSSVDPTAAQTDASQGGTFSGSAFQVDPTAAYQSSVQVGAAQAGQQQTVSNLQFAANTDWRVTLRLAPGATYLYNDSQPGLLAPLKTTNGVIFPYTPQISTSYRANYNNYDLTHSNYRGYFYQNSYVDTISLNAMFTAQSTADAAYVLAVIHFFRSVTKMFYGQDAQRGSPPPLVFLSGLGDYQFNNHPCLVTQFNYNLPADVDYVSSGTPYNTGLNLNPLQNLYSTTLNAISPTATRLANSLLPAGAQNTLPAPLQGLLSNPTYVPSKMEMQISLLPVQSRQQVSQQFSLKNFASGQQLKGGFW